MGGEVTEGKLTPTRKNDLVAIGGQFPRSSKPTASALIAAIRRPIQSLGRCPTTPVAEANVRRLPQSPLVIKIAVSAREM